MAERTLELTGLALALLLLARFGPPAIRSWRILSGVKTRRLADAGPLEISPPPPVATILDELRGFGFRRIGERSLVLPTGVRAMEWTWGDETGETYVAVVPSRVVGAMLSCYTAFADWTWLQTNFPRGETIDRPSYIARVVSESPTTTVAAHRSEIGRLRATHGSPRPVRTMADSLRMDAEYRTRYGGITLRPLTLRIMTPALAAGGLAIICALLLLLGR